MQATILPFRQNALFGVLLVLFLLGNSITSFGQNQNNWKLATKKQELDMEKLDRPIQPNIFLTYSLELEKTESLLSTAPTRFTEAAKTGKLSISLPMPDGSFEQFLIAKSEVMHPKLAKRYPAINTYAGHGIDDPTAKVILDITPKGFHAMVLSNTHSTVFIDPFAKGITDLYVVYYKKDYDNPDPAMICEVETEIHEIDESVSYEKFAGDCQLRTYRLALACTGEYAQFHGGTKPLAMAAMVTSMARVNGVFETDAGLTMQMIANNDDIIFLNAGSDPYTNGNGGAMLGQNQTTCDNVIGSANYDIGHVFSTGGGGVASLNSPCNNNSKARGVTGQNTPQGDPFDIDYVAHEMGHQYGANHTQNNSCNRNNATAMEPGSASTIMGYAGICNPNVQSNSDDHFHAISISEMANNIVNGTSSSCPVTTTTSNIAPTAAAGADHTVPIQTPIVLKGLATDANGDALTYCWEQMDNEIATMPPQAGNSGGPAFRSFSPMVEPDRYLPNLDAILNGVTPTWEVLPAVSRVMDWRFTVRDNNGEVGCTAEDDMRLTFNANAGPFIVQYPNTNVTWNIGATETVMWDVANTDSAPVSCSTVNVWLSTDGGFAYDFLLASGVPNTGSANIVVPAQPGTNNRIRVECATNVFFDVSDENFEIGGVAPPSFTMSVDPTTQSVCEGASNVNYTINLIPTGGFNENIQLSATGDPGFNFSFSSNNTPPVAPVVMTVGNINSQPPGTYQIDIFANSSSVNTMQTVFLIINQSTIGLSATVAGSDIVASITGGISPVTFSIDGVNFQSSNVFPNLPNGTYNITAMDGSGCMENVQVTVNALAITVTNVQNVTCNGSNDGSITVDVVGGNAPFLYSINSGPLQSSPTFLGLAPNSYIITVFDSDGFNIESELVTITEPPVLTISASVTDNIITASASGGSGSFTYSLDGTNYQASNIFTDAANGTYTVYVMDGNGCIETTTATVAFNTLVSSVANSTDASCFGVSDGTLTASATGGSLPYSYSIDGVNFQNDPLFTGLAAGTYTVTVMDADGFTSQAGPTTINEPTEITASASVSSDVITVTASGGTGALQYSIDGVNFQSSNVFNNVVNGTYTITVQDANGCTTTTSATVSVNNVVATIATSTDVSCFGFDDGTITAQATGGSEPYTYSIDGVNFQASNIFDNLSAGSYTITAMDADGFTADVGPTVITEPTVITASTSVSSDVITVTASGGTGTLQYSIDGVNFQSSNVFNNVANGTYTITVEDDNGCTTTTSATVSVNNVVATIATSTDVSCFGFDDGTITAQAAGGSEPYTYSIDGVNFQASNTFDNLSPGSYTITAMDADGFTADVGPTVIDEPSSITASTSVSSDVITVTASGGTDTLQYSIDGVNFQSSNVFNNVANGTYTITVEDANGCSTTASATVAVNNVVATISTSTDVSCFGFDDGTITAQATGGSTPYTYSIDGVNFQASNIFDNLSPESYTITAMDADGFTANVGPTVITEPTAITASTSVSSDVITVTASGGTGTLQYSIDGINFQSSNVFNNVANGTYTITMEDDNGCSTTTSATVAVNNVVATIATSTDVSCFGFDDGTITAQAAGGSEPYTYSIDGVNFQASNSFDNLSAGSYTITAMDADGFTADVGPTVITEPTVITASTSVSSDVITVTASGGTGTLQYSIDGINFQSSNVFNNVANGTYTITVEDDNGCSTTTSATVAVNNVVATIATNTDVSCFGFDDGTITAQAAGGNEPYTYSIDGVNFQASNSFDNLSAGSYTITAMDADGFTANVGPTVITEPTVITASTSVTSNMITVIASGGTGALQYSIDGVNFQSSNVFNNVANGTYTITVEDGNGSSTTTSATVSANNVVATIATSSDVSCFGFSDGTITAQAAGGNEPYTYSIDGVNFQASNSFDNLSAGSYTITAMDADGFTANVGPTVITEPTAITASTSVNSNMITVIASGGTGTLQYSIDGVNFQSSNVFNNVANGTYTITVEDANGCTTTTSATVSANNVVATIATSSDVSCFGFSDGTITAQAAGGNEPYTYSIDGVNFQASNSFDNLSAASYTITAMDADGFTANVGPTVISEPTAITASTSVNSNMITVIASGGTGTLQYSIDGVNFQSSNVFNNVANGTYTITVEDANGCTTTTSATVSANNVVATIATSSDVSCFGFSDGTITAQAAGGNEPYTYSIDGVNFQASNTFDNLSAGSYTITAMDADGFTANVGPTVITEPTVITASTSVTSNMITVTATGGTGALQYSIDGVNFQSSNVFNNVANGTYTITVEDGNGCSTTTSATVDNNDLAGTVSSSSAASCFGANDGFITVVATGGTEPYAYSINGTDFQISNTFDNLGAGSYTITVMDDNILTTTIGPITIGEPAELVLMASVNTNQITATASGGTAGYNYSLDGGSFQSSNIFNNVSNGTHELVVEDANGCMTSIQVTVSSTALTASATTASPISCFNASDGIIEVTASGGVAPLSYSLDGVNFQSSHIFDNLSPGNYQPVVQDANGMQVQSNTIVLTNPDQMNIDLQISDGTVEIFATGGVAPYMYQIDDGPLQSSNTFTSLDIGNYTAVAIDANGCEVDANFSILFSNIFDRLDELNFELFPNPNAGIFHLQLSTPISASTDLIIYDVLGRQVFKNTFAINPSGINATIDISDVPSGMYQLTLKNADQFGTKQLIVTK